MVNHKWKKIWMVSALLGSVAGAAEPAPQPVLVRFEHLAWVGAKAGLPRMLDGRIMAPAEAACDLLGLTCTIGKDSLSVGGQTLPLVPVTVIEQAGRQTVSVTALAPLVRLAGQSVGWNQAARVATVYGGSGSKGWRAVRAMFETAPEANPYLGPVRVSRGTPKVGQPTVLQTVFTEAPLAEITLFSKTAGRVTVVGSLSPSTPDNPNRLPTCRAESPRVCDLPVPRDALWTLALLTVK